MTPAQVRAQLAVLLEEVLPGRVQATPPTTKRYTAPSVWVDQVTISRDDFRIVGTFPVWVLADGAVDAQIAEHDDIVWGCLVAAAPIAERVEARPVQLAGLRATVVEVDVELDAVTLCGLESPVRYEPATLAG